MTAPTREQMTQWAKEAGFTVRDGVIKAVHSNGAWVAVNERLAEFAALAYVAGQSAEREACAKLLDQMADEAEQDCEPSSLVAYYREKAAAIRARGTA